MDAGWASTIASEANHKLTVEEVHGVELSVQGASDGGDGSSQGVQFEHATGVGGDEQVRAVKVEVARDRVSRQRPTEFPFNGAVGHERPLQQTCPCPAEITGVGRGPRRGPKVGGIGNDRSHLAAHQTWQVNHGLPSRRRKGGDFAVA